MEPAELAEEVKNVMLRACSRVGPGSIGAEQYHTEGEPQKFEKITFEQLREMYLEELEDIITYATMTHIRVRRLFEDLEKLDAMRSDQPAESAGVLGSNGLPFGAASFTSIDDIR